MARHDAVRVVLLDVDGTLVDSNEAHARSWAEALAEAGRHVAHDELRRRIGEGGDKILPQVAGLSADRGEGARIARRRAAIFAQRYLPRLRAFPRVRELLLALRGRGLRLVVASSAKAEELGALLEVAEAHDLVEASTSSDDADRSKPDPDVVVAALERARCEAAEARMLGDTPYDVAAARRAGVGTVALRCGGWSDEDLRGALAVYDDPADLLLHLDASPLADGRDDRRPAPLPSFPEPPSPRR